ncbi:MAG: type II toxin-antitoxin system prevent-host-death family antitoxin [Gammaproteobacteria bacterium]|nr:type II toxin-antitoxin system prevent-host-death family antitoxin [Gammaproteobacteria bacterium]MCY4198457.1 type II toxin-antitoxin system prevent-host-death family antitoxin [Gammaproteobacteria bacterium]MCY4277248.1 type II toxin-antitoxin system prevent-host-death family antitoxin [Gammaproteobacteria bacterium]
MQVNMHQAKSQLSKLGRLAWQGEQVIVAKAGEPWLSIVPFQPAKEARRMGGLEELFQISSDFDKTGEEITADIDASSIFPIEDGR